MSEISGIRPSDSSNVSPTFVPPPPAQVTSAADVIQMIQSQCTSNIETGPGGGLNSIQTGMINILNCLNNLAFKGSNTDITNLITKLQAAPTFPTLFNTMLSFNSTSLKNTDLYANLNPPSFTSLALEVVETAPPHVDAGGLLACLLGPTQDSRVAALPPQYNTGLTNAIAENYGSDAVMGVNSSTPNYLFSNAQPPVDTAVTLKAALESWSNNGAPTSENGVQNWWKTQGAHDVYSACVTAWIPLLTPQTAQDYVNCLASPDMLNCSITELPLPGSAGEAEAVLQGLMFAYAGGQGGSAEAVEAAAKAFLDALPHSES